MTNRRDKKISRKASTLLAENIIFVVLNLVFLSILILFVFVKTNNASTLEEKYAKQIALIIDASRPVMEIRLNMEDAFSKTKNNNWFKEDVVRVDNENNLVTVKLREKGGYSYSFFNDVSVSSYPSDDGKGYILIINKRD